jgi:hypothetical protein
MRIAATHGTVSAALWLGALGLAGGAFGHAQAAVCRVAVGGAGGNDGSSWAQATDLPSALADPACSEVWVAAGAYRPAAGTDRAATFAIRSGVAVYGGFAGTESARDQRDPGVHRSVLSGDIGGDDVVDAHDVTAAATDIVGSNSYHVVRIDAATADTVLDGFTLSGGQADGADTLLSGGGGLLCYGAGQACGPTLRRLLFRGNFAMSGGGMACVAQAQGSCDAVLEDAAFVGNAAALGGAVANAGEGGGVARVNLRNVTFSGNSATQGAGAFINVGGTDGSAEATLANVTFSANDAPFAGAVANFSLGGTAQVTLVESILWGDSPDEVASQDGTVSVRHSVLQGACPVGVICTETVAGNPQLGALHDADGAMPVLLPGAGSAAIDALACDDAPAADSRGVARPQGAGCDAGAAEVRQAHLVVAVSGAGEVGAIAAPPPLGAAIAECRQDTGACAAWYRVEPDAPAVALTLQADPGSAVQSASGCDGSLAGNTFTTGTLDGDCTVQVAFAPAAHAIGGTVTGLAGSGLVLSLNGAESLPVASDGAFAFDTTSAGGDPYAVSVVTQPSAPAQTCVVVNGSGTVGDVDVTDVVVHCGPALTYTVGGALSGLASGASITLSINGGNELTLATNGAYAFAPRFAPGDGYVVAVNAQPAGQHCTLVHAEGTIGGADVTNVDVACAAGGARLQLEVTDGGDYARYGQVRDYFVTLRNTGNVGADGVTVGADLDTAFDVANTQWTCVGGAPGTACTAQGAGGFADTATLPPGTSLVWIVRVPVRAGGDAATATFLARADGAGEAADTDTLVVFRDGVDVPYADGAAAVQLARGNVTGVATGPVSRRRSVARTPPQPEAREGAAAARRPAADERRLAAAAAAPAGSPPTAVPVDDPAALLSLLLLVMLGGGAAVSRRGRS